MAEASTMLWIVQLALCEGWRYVLFESDAKNHLDPLLSNDVSPEWSINNVISNIWGLVISFFRMSLSLVRRDCDSFKTP